MVCDGCVKREADLVGCTVYDFKGVLFREKQGSCPFNPPQTEAKKKRVRVGQQKQRKMK